MKLRDLPEQVIDWARQRIRPLKIIPHQTLTRQQIWELKRLWRMIPHVQCKGLCQDQCAWVPVYPVEALYIMERHPDARFLPASHGASRSIAPTLGAGGRCGFLNEAGRCSIYEDRPAICRMFGHTVSEPSLQNSLYCEHGCKASKPLESNFALSIYVSLIAALIPRGSRPLDAWAEMRRQFGEMVLLATSPGGFPVLKRVRSLPGWQHQAHRASHPENP